MKNYNLNDKNISIEWPTTKKVIISEKDLNGNFLKKLNILNK